MSSSFVNEDSRLSVMSITLLTLHCMCVLLLFVCWCQTLGLSSASTGMFNNGAGDLVLHFIAQCNSQLTEILAEQHKQVQLGQAEYVYTHLQSNSTVKMEIHRALTSGVSQKRRFPFHLQIPVVNLQSVVLISCKISVTSRWKIADFSFDNCVADQRRLLIFWETL